MVSASLRVAALLACALVKQTQSAPQIYAEYNGYFDSLEPLNATHMLARGWAYEPALNGNPSTVQIFVNGTLVPSLVFPASFPRPDIVPGGAPGPNHGFNVALPYNLFGGNARLDVFLQSNSWELNNSPRNTAGLRIGLPALRAMQGQDDDDVTSYLISNGFFATLDERYANINQTMQPGLRRYNLWWSNIESAVPSMAKQPLPSVCPNGTILVPSNETDRVARGFLRYHCYSTSAFAMYDEYLTRDAAIGAASAIIAYGTPAWAMLPGCTGFPWGQQMFQLGCYPWNNLDDWEDYLNAVAERYSAPVGSGLPRISGYVLWNEVQSMGWGDPSPILPNRWNGTAYTPEQMQTLVGIYANMTLRAGRAAARHIQGAMLWISFDHFMTAPPLSIGDVGHVGGAQFLDYLWPMLNQTVDWGIAVHPYDNGDPRSNLSSVGVFTFATLQEMVSDYQCQKLQEVANVPPQGCASQPQVMMYASEQGWAFNNVTMNETLRARNICFAQELSLAQGVWAVTHNNFQSSSAGQSQGDAGDFGLVPYPPIVNLYLSNGPGNPTYDAYTATGPLQWGVEADNFCCVNWQVGCP